MSSSKSPSIRRAGNSSWSKYSAISQSARLRNLSACCRLSTAMMWFSPRALSALIRFEPMKPAAPVTMIYKRFPDSVLEVDVDAADLGRDERHARRHRTEKLVTDGAGRRGNIVDRKSLAPEHRRAADNGLGHFGKVDGHQVHRYA